MAQNRVRSSMHLPSSVLRPVLGGAPNPTGSKDIEVNWIDLIEPLSLGQLIANAKINDGVKINGECRDFIPVVKLVERGGNAIWLLTESDESGRAYALCDTGVGTPELKFIDLPALVADGGPSGLPIEQDTAFRADKPISHYLHRAMLSGRLKI
jgi:hypothetical protein